MLTGKTVLIGVTGGVAAHYIPELIGQLRWRYMVNVQVIMTPAATRFITPLTLQAASGNPVYADLWEAAQRVPVIHVQLARLADLVLVAPATADILAKLGHGLADNLVTLTVLASQVPVVLAPAMHEAMWLNPIVQGNVARLRDQGYHFVGPERGLSATGEVAEGRMANIGAIISKLIEISEVERKDEEIYKCLHMTISAGIVGTPLRSLLPSNRRRQGFSRNARGARAWRRGKSTAQ